MNSVNRIAFYHYATLFIYSCVWEIFALNCKILSVFLPSIKRQWKARKISSNELNEIKKRRDSFTNATVIYCSSAGEYEQAIPLIKAIEPNSYIHIFFLSASGYEHAKIIGEKNDFNLAPPDTFWRWERLFKAIQPDRTIIVRHEFWPVFILKAAKHSKLYGVNISIKNEITKMSKWMRLILFKYFEELFFVSKSDVELIYDQEIKNVKIVGNTKFDRANQRKDAAIDKIVSYNTMLKKHSNNRRLIVGSAWEEDVHMILNAYLLLADELKSEWTIVIVPHNVNNETLKWIANTCLESDISCQNYSRLNKLSEVIIVNQIGILAELYGCCDATLIGGGFKQGTHNIVEPAIYHIPMVSGHITHTDREAYYFEKNDVLATVKNAEELSVWWNHCLNKNEENEVNIDRLLKENLGATQRIIDYIN